MIAKRRGFWFSADGLLLGSIYFLAWWAFSTSLYRSNPTTLGAAVLIDLTLKAGLIHYFLARAGWISLAYLSAILHLYGFLWLVGDAQALRLRPILVSPERLEIRLGLRWNCSLPLDQVKSVALCSAEQKEGFRMVLFGNPNVCLQLEREAQIDGLFGLQRASDCLLLQLDDPAGFCAALKASSAGHADQRDANHEDC